jgi:hypothetical protein
MLRLLELVRERRKKRSHRTLEPNPREPSPQLSLGQAAMLRYPIRIACAARTLTKSIRTRRRKSMLMLPCGARSSIAAQTTQIVCPHELGRAADPWEALNQSGSGDAVTRARKPAISGVHHTVQQ